VEPTPQGGMRMDASLTRAGILEYPGPNGTKIREYRPLEEVSRADSLDSLRDAPVTNRHPPGKVTAKNYRQYTVGHVTGEARMDGDLVVARLAVQDSSVLSAVEQGTQREVSCGYTCDLDETPGVLADGTAYDKIQRNITYNHVAIVERGRAGREVALRLDSEGNTVLEDTVTEAEIAALKAENEALKLKAAEQSTRADAAEGALAVAQAEVKTQSERADAASAPAAIEAAVKARSELLGKAVLVLGSTFKADGLDEIAVKTAVAAKAFPAVDLKDKPAAFIEPLFLAATSKVAKADADVSKLRGVVTPAADKQDSETDARSPSEKAKAKNRADSEAAHKKPLAFTSSK
jgi:hypothetical protein